jgi:hypothetical protein
MLAEATDAFIERLDRGEQPDVEEFAQRYPVVAEALRLVLPALQLLRASGLGAGAEPVAEAGTPLGDFRLRRARSAVEAWASSTRRSRCRWAGGWP